MVSLLDIAPLTEQVNVNGKSLDVRGISIEGIASLIVRFPEFKMLLGGRLEELDENIIATLGPKAIAAIIAFGTGTGVDREGEEKIAASLSLETQYDIVAVIARLTMPGGVGPFVDRLMSMFGQVEGMAKGLGVQIQDTNESNGSKTPAMNTPSPSKD